MNAVGYVAGTLGSVLIHLLVAFAVLGFPGTNRAQVSEPVEFEVQEPPPPPPPPPPPEPEPEPPRPQPAPVRRVVREVKRAPRPVMPPRAAPAPTPAAPIFGVDMTQTSPDGTVSVPVGETTIANPRARRPAKAAPAPVAPPPPPPVREVTIRDLPEVLAGPPTDGYPPECREAERNGVEGTVRLSVEVLASGKVGAVQLRKGIDRCLDAAAVRMARLIQFKPAIASDGKPARYRIKDYRFKFKIGR